jgi:multicomponent Na+:H+ antiporter subunit A
MAEIVNAIVAPSPLIVLIAALIAAPLTATLGWGRPRLGAALAIMSAAVTLVVVTLAWAGGGGELRVPWAPSWGLWLSLRFDGLSAVYGLLASGIGLVVLIYSSRYIPLHLHHLHRDPSEATTFYALILLFMGAMVGLVMADDLILLFLFWELTAVVSYFLIGFDRDDPASRPAALMALFVTGGSAILMLAGIVALWVMGGTVSVAELASGSLQGTGYSIAVGLIVVAALAKSAQVPLHFWLPRAMVAPTPVSSYLHSAAMVAAGVFLIARISPLVQRATWLPELLVLLGLASMAIGGLLAIGRDEMKRLLAYSTIAQYGYVVVMLGLGGRYGAIGAGFYVIAHGLAKCALFLTAGAVTEATGRKRLSEVGGLARELPVLAATSGVAAGALAALPLTIGFFKDELFFAAMLERGPLFVAAAVIGAGTTFAYAGRFWSGLFLGSPKAPASPLPLAMIGSIAVLAAFCLIGGIIVGPANELANAAGSATLLEPVAADLAYHLDTRPVNVMALAAYGTGLVLLLTLKVWSGLSARYAAASERFGPERLYRWALDSVNHISDVVHSYEVQDLRGRVATILVPVGILVGAGLVATPNEGAFVVGPLARDDLLLVLVLVATGAAALRAAVIHSHLSLLLLLSAVGYALATVFALIGAPDVALVAVLMETMISLLFVGFLSATRDRPQVEGFEFRHDESHTVRDRFVGVVSGAAAFVVVWGVLSKPAALESAALDQIALAPAAHAKDVVTAILSDFRGLDTMGEITVIGIAMIGLMTLIARPRPGRSRG